MIKICINALITFIFASQLMAANYDATYTSIAPTIDGQDADLCWQSATWAPIDQVWLGHAPIPQNCSAKFKACWKGDKLYFLMEVVDNVLVNWNPTEPLKNYPSNDCPEIFIDEDASGGEHTNSYNAFAYHIATTYDIVDVDVDGAAHLYNDHIQVKRTNIGNTYLWEMAVTVYNDQFVYGAKNNPTVNLFAGKKIGFSIAYNDSDMKYETRDAMIASTEIGQRDCYSLGYTGSGMNCSWQTASVFGTMTLIELPLSVSQEAAILQPMRILETTQGIVVEGEANSFAQVKIYNAIGTQLANLNMPMNQPINMPQLVRGNIYTIVAMYNGNMVTYKYFAR